MADETQALETKTPGKAVAAGAPERGEFKGIFPTQTATEPTVKTTEPLPAQQTQEPAQTQEPQTPDLPELTDEQIKQLFAKHGITEFEGFEKLKTVLEQPAQTQAPELTPEEKAAQEAAFEQRMLEVYLKGGGTVEHFVALKSVASMDLKELSIAQITTGLEAKGFTKDEIDAVLLERYYQFNPEELVKGEDETDEAFEKRKALAIKKAEYGKDELLSFSKHTKESAAAHLESLRQTIKEQELDQRKEAEFSSKVDEHFSKLSRKIALELGELNNKKIDPVSFDISESDVAEIVSILKDPVQRKQLLFTPENSLNLATVADLLVKNKIFESALKAAYLESSKRQVSEFEKIFPSAASNLGVGGQQGQTQQGRKGVPAKAGAPELVPRQR